jgi:hypothetical protein
VLGHRIINKLTEEYRLERKNKGLGCKITPSMMRKTQAAAVLCQKLE